MNKYGARRTHSQLCNRTFDSKAECIRGEELRLLELVGEIESLQYQVRFMLSQKPKVAVTIDFQYRVSITQDDFSGEWIYEDYKGVLTRDFRTKLAWLKEQQGIDVKLIRKGERWT